MLQETTTEIWQSILRHLKYEVDTSCSIKAIARLKAKVNESEMLFWLIKEEDPGTTRALLDFLGNETGDRVYVGSSVYRQDGQPVFRDSKFGEAILKKRTGNISYQAPKGKVKIYSQNLAQYTPNPLTIDAEDVSLWFDTGIHEQYRSLITQLQSLKVISETIERKKAELEKASSNEVEALNREIEEKKKQYSETARAAQSFMRMQAQLRIQPILDPDQDRIKRQGIYDKTIIIDGGPGTGKTTTLIQRIKFLTSREAMTEYVPEISKKFGSLLFDSDKNWIFFSPSELLRLYLQNAMVSEGLTADNNRVKVWASHRSELCKSYKLFNTETKRPFLSSSDNAPLFVQKNKTINQLIDSLDSFFIKIQIEKFRKLVALDVSQFIWKLDGKSIQRYVSVDIDSLQNVDDVNRKLYNLQNEFSRVAEKINQEYKSNLVKITGLLQVGIRSDTSLTEQLFVLLKEWSKKADDPIDEDEETDNEAFGESEEIVKEFDFDVALNRHLKSLVRKSALKKYDPKVRFTEKDKKLLELIPQASIVADHDTLGQLVFFKKHVEGVLRGVESNTLQEIPRIYKQFRKELNLNLLTPSGNRLLMELIKNKNNRIHVEEQSLLLLFINRLIKRLATNFRKLYNETNDRYVQAYKENCRPVIAIDEATDFPIIDLLAINSFKNPDIGSVTLCGDLMQRLTVTGISTWEEFTDCIGNSEVTTLQISYRQTPTLLDVAIAIYMQSMGKMPIFRSYTEMNEHEPKAIKFISTIEEKKVEWIAKRILEVYRTHDNNIPSIAVFVENDEKVERFANALGQLDLLRDVDISVKACRNGEVLGDKNPVRVFSVEYIKGLEFEVAFFHNLDDLTSNPQLSGLLDKYLYVGLSRASTYLAITAKQPFSSKYDYLNDIFSIGRW